jgi:hypothetical protein
MDFHEWVTSEEITAKDYRWYFESCGVSSRDDLMEAAKNAFKAGRKEGLKEATHKIVRRLTETI